MLSILNFNLKVGARAGVGIVVGAVSWSGSGSMKMMRLLANPVPQQLHCSIYCTFGRLKIALKTYWKYDTGTFFLRVISFSYHDTMTTFWLFNILYGVIVRVRVKNISYLVLAHCLYIHR
jgi:hypothetical protein